MSPERELYRLFVAEWRRAPGTLPAPSQHAFLLDTRQRGESVKQWARRLKFLNEQDPRVYSRRKLSVE